MTTQRKTNSGLITLEPSAKFHRELKLVDAEKGIVEGWGIPFGGPFEGKDFDGEFFAADTDFRFDWFPNGRPMLWDHGKDSTLGLDLIGRQIAHKAVDDVGVWAQGQINMAHRYASAVIELIEQGLVGFSSLALKHLVDVDKTSGKIVTWPWVELTLTTHPANPLAMIEAGKTAASHFSLLGIDVPEAIGAGDDTPPPGDAKEEEPEAEAPKAINLPDGMSLQDFEESLRAALRHAFPALMREEEWCWLAGIYEDSVVFQPEGVGERYFQADFAVDDQGNVTITGQPREVERVVTYEAVAPGKTAAPSTLTYGDHAEHVLADVQAFMTRSKSLADLKARDGRRPLSDANRSRLQSLEVAMKGVGDGVSQFLADYPSDPAAPDQQEEPPTVVVNPVRHLRLLQGLDEVREGMALASGGH